MKISGKYLKTKLLLIILCFGLLLTAVICMIGSPSRAAHAESSDSPERLSDFTTLSTGATANKSWSADVTIYPGHSVPYRALAYIKDEWGEGESFANFSVGVPTTYTMHYYSNEWKIIERIEASEMDLQFNLKIVVKSTTGKELNTEYIDKYSQDIPWNYIIPYGTSKCKVDIHCYATVGDHGVTSLNNVSNGGRTNKNVTYTWDSDFDFTAKLDGKSYSNGSSISSEGSHVIEVTDYIGNTSTYSFTIDKTAPIIQMYRSDNNNQFADGALLNCFPYFKVPDSDTSSVFISNSSGVSYNWKTISTQTVYYDNRDAEASRIYYATRNELVTALRSKEHSLNTVSKSNYAQSEEAYIYEGEQPYAYIGNNYSRYYYTAKGLSGQYYVFFNDSVRDTFIESNLQNYISSTSKTLFLHEGKWTISATDTAGNVNSKTFTIDITPPTSGALSGVTNGSKTNQDVTFTWGADATRATLNGSSYTKNSVINQNGKYIITLYDATGNYTTYSFEIDKTAPVGTLSGVSNGGRTKGNVSFSWTEAGATATLNGSSYKSGTVVSAEGSHTIVLTDDVGNSATYTFTIDRTAPVGTLTGVESGGRTNSTVTFSWEKANTTATLDNKSYTKNSKITAEGSHTIVLTDDVGNSATYTFTIDKTAPTGKLEGVANGGKTKGNVTFSWTEAGATATLNGAAYASKTVVSAEGSHTIVLTDDVGNSRTYTFTIDRTAPEGTLSGVSDKGRTKGNVLFSWKEAGATATLNGAAYTSNTVVSAEGDYTIILTDDVGNSRTYTFTIDKTAPEGKLTGVANGGKTNGNVSFSWTEAGATATLNLSPYNSGAEIRNQGTYQIILRDTVGNENKYSFEIDKTPATGSFSEKGNTVNNIIYFKTAVSFSCSEPGATAELKIGSQTIAYNFGELLGSDNNYTLNLYDEVGNLTSYRFVIDTAPFTENFNYIQSKYKSNISAWFETYSYKLSTSNNYVADKYYSFVTYADSYKYAYNRERATIESGVYKGGVIYNSFGQTATPDITNIAAYVNQNYVIYKSANNSSTLTAYFNLSNLEAALSRYAQLSVTNKYIPSVPSTPFPGDNNIGAQAVMRDLIYISDSKFTLPYSTDMGYLYINGQLSEYKSVLNAGLNYIEEIDFAGNITSYNIILDIEAPRILCSDILNNSLPNYEESLNNPAITDFRFDRQIVLSLIDNFDESCLLIITHNGLTEYVINSSYTCNESGLYNFIIYDTAGNTRSGDIYVSIEAPEIQVTENLDNQMRLIDFNVNIIIHGNFVQLSDIEVFYKTSDSIEYNKLSSDADSANITSFKTKYKFNANGDYRVIIRDNFNRSIIKEYTFTREAPIGTLYLRGGDLVGDRKIVNKDIYFTWNDTAIDYAFYTFNNGPETEYWKQTYLTTPGDYVFYLRVGGSTSNQSVYRVTIDTVAPVGELYYLKDNDNKKYSLQNNGKTAGDVYFTYNTEEEPGATVRYTKNDSNVWITYNGEALTLDGKYTVQLYDAAQNMKSYSFEIDKTAPEISIKDLSGNLLANHIVTNQNIKFTWGDYTATASLNGQTYKKDSVISNEGDFTLQLTDDCGNFNVCYVTIDKTAPVGELTGVESGGRTSGNVSFSWTETNVTATLNGETYVSGATIFDEGSFVIVIKDIAGNTSTYTFTIDRTAPEGKLTGVENGGYTNSSVSFTWNDLDVVSAKLDSHEYKKRELITVEGTHTIVLTDDVGNSATYTFTIDTTAPEGTLTGVDNGGITNGNVTFSWLEEEATALLNGVPYLSGTELDAIGKYTIVLTDQALNRSTYSFEISRTTPIGTLSGVINGGKTNGNVSFNWNDFNAFATINGNSYTKRQLVVDEGEYSIVLTDAAGNTSTYTFTIDKTAPVGELTGVESGGRTNGNVSFSWAEEAATATLNGLNLLNGSEITDDDTYTIVLTDDVGNSATYTFTIDKTAPEGTLSGVESGGYTNSNVSFTWNDLDVVSAKLDAHDYKKRELITTEGTHTIILTDDVGNSATYTFTIDRTAPEGELYGANNGGRTNGNVSFSWAEEAATATLNGVVYESNTVVSLEGEYSIVLTDAAGNTSTYTFTIDKSTPLINFSCDYIEYENTFYFNTDFSFSFDEYSFATLNGEPYSRNTLITAESTYEIIIVNSANTENYYLVILDKTAPEGTLSGVENGGLTNHDILFVWTEETATATLNGEVYDKLTSITSEGQYSVVLKDIAGNTSTYTFTIDKTAPVGTLTGVEDDGRTNGNVSFSWTEAGATAVINDEPYKKGATIEAEGLYHIVLSDAAGNTTTYIFTIIKTLPVGELTGVENGGRTNGNVSFSWDPENSYTATINGYIYINGTAITTEGTHTIILTDDVGNSRTYTFTVDKTAPEGTLSGVESGGRTNGNVSFAWSEYSCTALLNDAQYKNGSSITTEGTHTIILTDDVGNSTMYTFTIDKTAPVGELTGVESGGRTNGNVSFAWAEETATATLNGEIVESITGVSAEGDYTIVLTDDVGNSRTYTFTIDKTAPEGTLSGVDEGGCTNNDVSFSWTETNVTATLNDEPYKKRTLIATDGIYTIVLTDDVGNSRTYTFTVDKTAPVGTLSKVEEGGYTNNDVTFSWTEEAATATLNGAAYESDTVISAEGSYKVILTDTAGNTSTYTFTIDKTAPEISGIENGAKINQACKLSWLESNCNATVSFRPFEGDSEATLNDYQKNGFLTEDGYYVITVTDMVGNSSSIAFEIKKSLSAVSIIYSDEELPPIAEIKNNNTYTLSSDFNITSADHIIFNEEEEYISGTIVTQYGTYNVNILDDYGNSISFKVVFADNAAATTSGSGSSLLPNILLGVFGSLAVIAIVVRVSLSFTKKKRKLKT